MTASVGEQVAAMLLHIRALHVGSDDVRDPSKRLKSDLGFDQIDLMSLGLELEDRFGLALGDDALLALGTVGDVVAAVTDHGSAGAMFTPPGTAGALRVAPAPADPFVMTDSLPCKSFAGGKSA